jgi:Outer membrane protein beta-barrel domain
MPSPYSMPRLRHSALLSVAVVLAVGAASARIAAAQVSPSHDPSSSAAVSESSSSAAMPLADDANGDGASLPSAPAAAGNGAAQEGGGGYHHHSLFSHMTFEAGGGFNAPTSDSSPYITWGGNINVGAGYKINPRVSVLTEYQFIDDKLPGALIAETGATGGNAHIWSFTIDPVVDLAPKRTNDLYVTGGGGFYRKVTNFTDPEPAEYCTYFYCGVAYENTVVGHFSSNQGGWNVGGGFTHRLGGIYGDGSMKLFAEVRYLDVDTPAQVSSPNGLGTTSVGADTKLIPVTFGVRW